MRLNEQRQAYTTSNKALRRARYLFIYLHRAEVLTGPDKYMAAFVEALRKHGLYSNNTSNRDIRGHVLRRLFKVHNPHGYTWYEWYAHYKWGGRHWSKQA